jgi:phosphate butyryltransferase
MRNGQIKDFDGLLDFASTLPQQRVILVYPNNVETFAAIAQALKALRVQFTLVGDQDVIQHGLAAQKISGKNITIVDQPDVHAALRVAIDLVRDGKGDLLMKGSVDTSTMMKAVLKEDSGLRTGKLLGDIFILEYPPRKRSKFVMITDGGMTLAPDLKNKVELINNAVAVAHALGNRNPKVAILSATEFVLPNLPSTLDAAALAKMNERGQIKGCTIDGPLALDNALSPEAAREKKIKSHVAGKAEILVAANIESANSLAKGTTYFGSLRLAHVIVGASVPILIPSRADKADAKLLSIALGMIMSRASRNNVRD